MKLRYDYITSNLTYGKRYEILETKTDSKGITIYRVIDDNDELKWFFKEVFEDSKPVLRDDKINSILNESKHKRG